MVGAQTLLFFGFAAITLTFRYNVRSQDV